MKQNQIIFRKADINDNFYEMARLLYETDPYIYPFWKPSAKEFAEFMAPWINTDGFIFSFRNFYIAHEKDYRFPLAIMVIMDNRSHCELDYRTFVKRTNTPETDFVVEHYLKKIIDSVQSSPDNVAYGIALSVNPAVRGRNIGSRLFEKCLNSLKHHDIDTLYFDCLMSNRVARTLYEKRGFENIGEGIGFDGTLNSRVKIVNYRGNF